MVQITSPNLPTANQSLDLVINRVIKAHVNLWAIPLERLI